MAERSNASDSSSDLSGGAGSNPVGVIIKKTYSDTFIIAKWITRWTQNPTGLNALAGSNPADNCFLTTNWSHSVGVSTSDFESGNPSSNLGGT